MRNVARIGAIVFLLLTGLSTPRASAVIFFCSDICSDWRACSFRCTDDLSGFASNCGNYGCCTGNTTNCV
jgi:hypothetical protein